MVYTIKIKEGSKIEQRQDFYSYLSAYGCAKSKRNRGTGVLQAWPTDQNLESFQKSQRSHFEAGLKKWESTIVESWHCRTDSKQYMIT